MLDECLQLVLFEITSNGKRTLECKFFKKVSTCTINSKIPVLLAGKFVVC